MYKGFRHNNFSRGRGNGFRAQNGQNRARRISKLEGRDPSMFIKQASLNTPQEVTYTPTHTFDSFDISQDLKANIKNRNYTALTPIQDQGIQPILDGRDFIGLANTGTGKTAAFLIPILDKIIKDRRQKAIILAPTRELALQIDDEFRKFAFGLKIFSTVAIGGAPIKNQIYNLRRNPNVVIGTPGRIKDLIQQNILGLSQFSIFVLDEVDLMVDIGFINDVEYFVSLLPQNRQSLFFSATLSPKIKVVLDKFVHNPVSVNIKKQDTSENINQNVIKVAPGAKKIDLLHDLLIKSEFQKVLIFGRTKHGLNKLHLELQNRGFKAGVIHSNKSQSQRQTILRNFKQNFIKILLATDVASRGLDIDNVSHVINYDLPENYEDYIHRIGRTGRAGKIGHALTFVN